MKGNSLTQLKANIKTVLESIPTNIYKNIFKGSYKREIKYTILSLNSNMSDIEAENILLGVETLEIIYEHIS